MNNVLLHPDSQGANLSEWLSGNGGTGLENALSDLLLIRLPTLINTLFVMVMKMSLALLKMLIYWLMLLIR
jgi:hypothetical protein